jgi:hypothetical protein
VDRAGPGLFHLTDFGIVGLKASCSARRKLFR